MTGVSLQNIGCYLSHLLVHLPPRIREAEFPVFGLRPLLVHSCVIKPCSKYLLRNHYEDFARVIKNCLGKNKEVPYLTSVSLLVV